MPGLTFVTTDPAAPAASALLRAYYDDIVGRYWGRPALPTEVDAAMADEPSDDLQGDTGLLVVAFDSDRAVACGGVRFTGDALGDLTRIYVAPDARGLGAGAELIGRLEELAVAAGLSRLRLTVRTDLVEARRLYRRCGYLEVVPFNTDPYAEHWLAKELH